MKIALVGELCEDIIMHSPSSHEVLGTKIWAEDITITAGGSASYATQALCSMGLSTMILSSLGDDESGERILRQLSRLKGADCSAINLREHERTTRSMIVCDGSKKEFIGCSPMLEIEIPQIDELNGVDLVYIAGYALYPELWNDKFIQLLQEAGRRGMTIVLDCQLLPIEGVDLARLIRLQEILRVTDHVLFAKKEMRSLLGTEDPQEATKVLRSLGYEKTAIFKLGSSGCVVDTARELIPIAAYQVEVYDAVGAGDIFGAAYCYGTLSGWGPNDCARFATIYAAGSLGRFEENRDYPEVHEVMKIVERHT